ncbi:MAG: Ig-like domain repeat protein [Candidatus Gracilibacteria bacterium]
MKKQFIVVAAFIIMVGVVNATPAFAYLAYTASNGWVCFCHANCTDSGWWSCAAPTTAITTSVGLKPTEISAAESVAQQSPKGSAGEPQDMAVLRPAEFIITMTASDLGVKDVGILPTSNLYFLKEWGRGFSRFFTWRATSRVKLELEITNQIAAELLKVEAFFPNGVGVPGANDLTALKNALENYTKAQERLNMRIGKLPAISNPNVGKLLKEVDEKTAKHAGLLEQLTGKYSGQLRFEVVGDSLKKAQDNILKTFTVTVTSVNDAPSLKQKAEDQIKRAGVAISEANSAMQEVSTARGIRWDPVPGTASYMNVTVPKQTQGATFGEKMKADDELNIFDRWGNLIAKAKGNLESAKKAFAEGEYGEAYGQARFAEAAVVYSDEHGEAKTAPTPAASSTTVAPDVLEKVKQSPTQEKTETPPSPVSETPAPGPQSNEVKSETITTMTSSLNPSTSNQSVTFTATVTGGVAPTGSVTFSLGLATLGTGTLNSYGVAIFTTFSLSNATHIITATYSGDETHSSSISSPFSQTVNIISESGNTEPSSNDPMSPGSGNPL